MQNIQEVFNKIQELKKERKEIQKEYRDMLINTEGYEEITEEIKKKKEKKKELEVRVQSKMGIRYQKFEEVKSEIEKNSELLTDIAMTNLMKGEGIHIKDENEVEYEPVYKIAFKKIG